MSDHSSGIYRPQRTATTTVERGSTLDAFTAAASGPGVAMGTLEPLSALLVQTRNTRYHIIVSRGAEILIQGGAFFPEPTAAYLEGASLGTSLLKVGWIGVGLRMEIRCGERRIVTTAVHSISAVEADSRSRTH